MSLTIHDLVLMAFILDGGPQTGGLRSKRAPVITLHTSENPPGTRNLALAVYIRDRRTLDGSFGSYHSLSDCHGDGMQLAGLSLKVWHAPTVNDVSLSHSFVTRAASWKDLTPQQRDRLLQAGAERCHRMSRWCVSIGVGPVLPRLITDAQARAGVSGFTYHSIVQSRDRTDPGRDFPREDFFRRFTALENAKAEAKPVAQVKNALRGWNVAAEAASLHVAPLSTSTKVRDVEKGDPLLIAADAEATEWWIQVGDFWIQRNRIEKGNGSSRRRLFHGNFPDRPLPVNGTRTTELDLAWEELLYRLGEHTGAPYADLHRWLGKRGYTGSTEQRRQRFLAHPRRGYYTLAVDAIRGPGTLRAEKEFLNDQRDHFTPTPASAMPALRGYAGTVY